MRFFIRRAKRIFESNQVPFLWNSVNSGTARRTLCRCTSEEFISVIYCRPPADYQADRDIKEQPDKTGFNLWSLSAMASFIAFPLRLFSMSKNRLAIIETHRSRKYSIPGNHYRGSTKFSSFQITFLEIVPTSIIRLCNKNVCISSLLTCTDVILIKRNDDSLKGTEQECSESKFMI